MLRQAKHLLFARPDLIDMLGGTARF